GTSWMDSVRRRAVTSSTSRVARASSSAASAAGASCAVACRATRDRVRPMARLSCLRFMVSPRTCVSDGRSAGCTADYVRAGGAAPVPWYKWSPAPRLRTLDPCVFPGVLGHVLPDRAGGAVFPDVRGLSRLQRHPVRAGRGPGRGAADRPVPGGADVHRPVHGQDGGLPEALFP